MFMLRLILQVKSLPSLSICHALTRISSETGGRCCFFIGCGKCCYGAQVGGWIRLGALTARFHFNMFQQSKILDLGLKPWLDPLDKNPTKMATASKPGQKIQPIFGIKLHSNDGLTIGWNWHTPCQLQTKRQTISQMLRVWYIYLLHS